MSQETFDLHLSKEQLDELMKAVKGQRIFDRDRAAQIGLYWAQYFLNAMIEATHVLKGQRLAPHESDIKI